MKTDYWKSQDKKYCDFCKCWIADNRPSVEFHEKGKRHQENVKKKLKYITKKSERAERESERNDFSIRQMESAALEAYRKDVENNADLTSIAINKKLKEDKLEIKGSGKIWNQLKSKEGDIYYWNTVTDETIWEPPEQGFLSLEEQKEEAYIKTKQQMNAVEKERRKDAFFSSQKQKQEDKEEKARLLREKLKERRVADSPEPIASGPIIEQGNPTPYGQWQTIKESTYIDLQLPKQQEYYEPVIEYEPEPMVKEFKEKTVENLVEAGSSGETTFKKRKVFSGNKKNARRRLDND